jgi:hypothetical protein
MFIVMPCVYHGRFRGRANAHPPPGQAFENKVSGVGDR